MRELGILVALPSEAECLGGVAPRGTLEVLAGGVRLLVGGVGPAAAEAGARALLDGGARALVSLGVAGGLHETLRAGELVLPERVRDAGGEVYAVDVRWRAALSERLAGGAPLAQRGGLLVESAKVVADPRAKRELGAAHGALAVDMESGAVARVAHSAGAPLLVVRAIADAWERPLCPAALCVDRDGRLRKRALLRSLLRDPRQILTLLALRADFHAAQATLREVWRRAGPDLGLGARG